MRQGSRVKGGPLVPVALVGLFVVGIGLILGTVVVASAGNQSSTPEPGPRVTQTPDAAKTPDTAGRHDLTRTPTASPVPSPTPSSTPRPTATEPVQLTLADAIESGLVQAQIAGNGPPGGGFSSGDVIHIGLTKTGGERLEIELPRGTVLLNTTPGFQDMVVTAVKGRISGPTAHTYSPASKIVLDDEEEQWFVAEAYCLDFYGKSPEYSTDLTVGGMATPEVLAVLDAAARMGRDEASIEATQIAVWAVTQDPSRAQVQARVETDDEDFSQARGILQAAGVDPASTQMFQY